MQSLPIDSLIPQIKSSLQTNPNLIIEATPGAGKTTRVPPALLDPQVSAGGEVWVLEPRRIAARLSARRVAEEMGERLGETVGFQVRFEEISSPRTRLRFLTEGVLTRRLLSNPSLKGVAAIVLDEFHERHLQSDLALALLRHVQVRTRPDLQIIVMSATLEAAPLATYLGNCPILRCEGRRYEVSVAYQHEYDARPLAEQLTEAIRKTLAEQSSGDLLVFLPGAAEIKRTQKACASLAAQAKLLVIPLHGELSSGEQDAAVRPANQRKVILATNVAETSITIDGVVAVIDSGLARVAAQSPWSGLPTLHVQRISQASATQRAGRAGRTQAGRCLRLFTQMDFTTRPAYETPEIQRLDLAGAILDLYAQGIKDISRFDWYEAPSAQAIELTVSLLRKLGAVNHAGEITDDGRRMIRLPLHPRQSRLFLEAEKRGVPRRGALIAALIGERDLRTKSFSVASKKAAHSGESDLFEQEALYELAQDLKFDPVRLLERGINPETARAIQRTREQIMQRSGRPSSDNSEDKNRSDESIQLAILAGYSDRVARRQESDNARDASASMKTLYLMNGAIAQLSFESIVRESEYLVAVEAEEKKSQRTAMTVVRTASAIKVDWLLDMFANAIEEQVQIEWNPIKECVEVLSQLCYGKIILDENRLSVEKVNEAEKLRITKTLAEAVAKKGWQYFLDAGEITRLLARFEFINIHFPTSNFPSLEEPQILALLVSNCHGKSSFAEVKASLNIEGVLRQLLSSEQLSFFMRMVPERIHVAGRKNLRINYDLNKPPWIASRLQDFFGMTSSPTIGQGSVPLVLHLLAPNQRPVQVTSDLPGFWTRIYPQVRRELSRRYPKHSWPEDPLHPTTKGVQKK